MKLLDGLARMSNHIGKARMRHYLLGIPNHQLVSWGFSPAQLKKGITAWPWRIEEQPTDTAASTPRFSERELRKTVKELQSFTNAELADIGLTRGTIEQAVRHGRAGVEANAPSQAA